MKWIFENTGCYLDLKGDLDNPEIRVLHLDALRVDLAVNHIGNWIKNMRTGPPREITRRMVNAEFPAKIRRSISRNPAPVPRGTVATWINNPHFAGVWQEPVDAPPPEEPSQEPMQATPVVKEEKQWKLGDIFFGETPPQDIDHEREAWIPQHSEGQNVGDIEHDWKLVQKSQTLQRGPPPPSKVPPIKFAHARQAYLRATKGTPSQPARQFLGINKLSGPEPHPDYVLRKGRDDDDKANDDLDKFPTPFSAFHRAHG